MPDEDENDPDQAHADEMVDTLEKYNNIYNHHTHSVSSRPYNPHKGIERLVSKKTRII